MAVFVGSETGCWMLDAGLCGLRSKHPSHAESDTGCSTGLCLRLRPPIYNNTGTTQYPVSNISPYKNRNYNSGGTPTSSIEHPVSSIAPGKDILAIRHSFSAPSSLYLLPSALYQLTMNTQLASLSAVLSGSYKKS